MVAERAVGLPVEVFRMRVYQHRIRRGVVIHHVDQHLHAECVRGIAKMRKIVHRTELRIDGAVIFDRVRRT